MILKTRDIAIVGVFSALAYAGGFALIFVPNVEIFTALIFLSGLIFGTSIGALVGGIAAFLYGMINPWGVSPLPLLISQVASRIIAGYAGGLLGNVVLNSKPFWFRSICYALASILLIWTYIVFSNLSGLLAFGYTFEQLKIYFVSGLPAYLLLTLANVLIFALVLPWVTPIILNSPYITKFTNA